MAKSAIDATINNEVFRKDNPIIIALRRDLATLSPVRLAYDSGGYKVGQVLAYDTVNKLYKKYSGVSATYPAKAVLFEPVRAEDQIVTAASGNLARAVFAGHVYKDLCLDLSAQAITDLKAVAYTDATETNILKF